MGAQGKEFVLARLGAYRHMHCRPGACARLCALGMRAVFYWPARSMPVWGGAGCAQDQRTALRAYFEAIVACMRQGLIQRSPVMRLQPMRRGRASCIAARRDPEVWLHSVIFLYILTISSLLRAVITNSG